MNQRNEIVFDLIPEHRLCRFFGRGLVALSDIMVGIEQVNRHQDFHSDFSTVVCFEEATVSFGEGDLSRYRDFFRKHQEGRTVTRWALVAGDDITVSTARLAHLLEARTRISFKSFRDRKDALRWLGRPTHLADLPGPWTTA